MVADHLRVRSYSGGVGVGVGVASKGARVELGVGAVT